MLSSSSFGIDRNMGKFSEKIRSFPKGKDSIEVAAIALISAVSVLTIFLSDNFSVSTILPFLINLGISAYCLFSLKERMGLLFFNLAIFLFLLARPVIDLMTGFVNHVPNRYTFETGLGANRMLLVALLGLFLGQWLYEHRSEKMGGSRSNRVAALLKSQEGLIRRIALAGYLISLAAMTAVNLEKLIFRRSYGYAALYAEFKTGLPFVVIGFAEVGAAFLALYLATRPQLKYSLITLASYLGSTAILLFAGVRSTFSRSLLFSVFLVLQLLASQSQLTRQVKKRLIGGFVLMGLLLIPVFYGIGINRWNVDRLDNGFPVVIDFIYGQGVSYQTLAKGQELIELPPFDQKNYALGPFLDQYVNDLPENPYTPEYIERGDSMAADLGYYLLGSQYFKGMGMGSSYIIEIFSEFGFPGVFAFSGFLGLLLGSLSNITWKNSLIDVVKIRILLDIFYIPRAAAIRFLLNLIAPKFFLPILFTIILACCCRTVSEKWGKK